MFYFMFYLICFEIYLITVHGTRPNGYYARIMCEFIYNVLSSIEMSVVGVIGILVLGYILSFMATIILKLL